MRTIHESASHIQGRTINILYSEQFHPDASADDVNDGINRSDLMKMDLLHSRPVDLRFGLGEPPKDGNGALFHAWGQVAPIDDLHDMREVTVGVLFSHFDVELGG